LRWVAIVGAVWLATATHALAESPAGPDPAPRSSQSPRPDPAPGTAKPAKPVVKAVATVRAPVQSTTPAAASRTTVTPATTASKPAQRETSTHAKKPARHQRKRQAPAATKHRAAIHIPSLPHLSPARLIAPQTTDGSGRARKLAAGALSLLILALASATLLAFTARMERRRVVR
jgi:ribonuclease E